MTNNNTLFGDWAKPADTLIKKISKLVAGTCEPWQIKRVSKAKAEAGVEASRIKLLGNMENKALTERALQRIICEEVKKQENIESITSQSLPQLNKNAQPENIEDDWIINFFDKCKLVSDKEMQIIWSKILASEANTPGKFSKRTINCLSSLDKYDAETFTKFCAFNWTFVNFNQSLIYDLKNNIYKNNGIDYPELDHLDSIGLINFCYDHGFERIINNKEIKGFSYDKKLYSLVFPRNINNHINVGYVMLTNVGEELATICNPVKISKFENYVINKWKKNGIKVDQISKRQAS